MIQLPRNIHVHIQNNNFYLFNIAVLNKKNWVSHDHHWDSNILQDLSREVESQF